MFNNSKIYRVAVFTSIKYYKIQICICIGAKQKWGDDTTRQRQRTLIFVYLLYLQILPLNISKNVRYYRKSCLRGRRNWALMVLFQVCILKKSNYTHIKSFVRTKHVNSYVIWICFFKVDAACYKSKYVNIKWEI